MRDMICINLLSNNYILCENKKAVNTAFIYEVTFKIKLK